MFIKHLNWAIIKISIIFRDDIFYRTSALSIMRCRYSLEVAILPDDRYFDDVADGEISLFRYMHVYIYIYSLTVLCIVFVEQHYASFSCWYFFYKTTALSNRRWRCRFEVAILPDDRYFHNVSDGKIISLRWYMCV